MQCKSREHCSFRSAAAGSDANWPAWRYFQFISKPQKLMLLYGLIGHPLTHSFSKNYFTEKFKKEGLGNCRYENFPLTDINDLPKIINENPDLHGINVTIPYKESVLQFLHEVNDLVKQTRACNCIKITNKKLAGFNTDVIGF